MKKILVGLAAAAAIVTPLAAAGTASAATTPAKATGTVSWNYQDQVTGTVTFNANAKTGGTLDYQNSNGQWLHAVVTPSSVQKTANGTVVFAGEITSGSDDYTVGHDGTDYFAAKVVDGSTSGRNGDLIAVFANTDGYGTWLTGTSDTATTVGYQMNQDTAGTVTAGNLTVF